MGWTGARTGMRNSIGGMGSSLKIPLITAHEW